MISSDNEPLSHY